MALTKLLEVGNAAITSVNDVALDGLADLQSTVAMEKNPFITFLDDSYHLGYVAAAGSVVMLLGAGYKLATGDTAKAKHLLKGSAVAGVCAIGAFALDEYFFN